MNEFLNTTFFGNDIRSYVGALLVFIALSLVFKLVLIIVNSKLKRLVENSKTIVDDVLLKVVNNLKPPFYLFVALYLGIRTLFLDERFLDVLNVLLIIWIFYEIMQIIHLVIGYVTEIKSKDSNDPNFKNATNFVGITLKILLWTIGILMILANFGVNITSLVAGLGIGGIAVAFALQKILGDLFSSFAIYFDKPFKVGDFIVVGDKLGVVQKIGIKTTRIKALQGEELIIPNTTLTSENLQNFKQMKERRVSFKFGVTYDTPNKKLEKIPSIVKDTITQTENTRFDRAHFIEFGDSAFIFEVVYFVLSAEYNEYMNSNQNILLGIRAKLEKEKVEFAFPTQTIVLSK